MPQAWKAVKVVFIPKAGRDSYVLAKAFRPICLASFMLKTMERLIDREVRERPLWTYPLHRYSYAYLAGKSTEAALHNLVSRIEKALASEQYGWVPSLILRGHIVMPLLGLSR